MLKLRAAKPTVCFKRPFYESAAHLPVTRRFPTTLIGAPARGGTRRTTETFTASSCPAANCQ